MKRETLSRRSEIGAFGEKLVATDLKTKGYRILERNYLKPWGELDVVAIAPDRTLVFVEVKTLRQNSGQALPENESFTPEKNLTRAKLVKLQRTAQLFAGHRPELVDEKMGWRIDLAAITLRGDGEKPLIRYYENL